jgi:hypothetical protein
MPPIPGYELKRWHYYMSDGVKKQVFQHNHVSMFCYPHFKRQKNNISSLMSALRILTVQDPLCKSSGDRKEGTFASDKEGRKLTFQELIANKASNYDFMFNQ